MKIRSKTIPIGFNPSDFGQTRSIGFYAWDRSYHQWRNLRYHIASRSGLA